MGDFLMPSLGADMDAGTLVAWHVSPGAHVKRGDVVASVETDKGLVEVEIWEGGIVDEIKVGPGTKVPVGTVLATLRAEATPDAPPPPPPIASKESGTNGSRKEGGTNGATAPAEVVDAPRVAPPAAAAPVVRASPAARQLAREHDVDLTKLHGTGPHDAITRGDVARAIEGPAVTGAAQAPTRAPAPAPVPDRSGAMRRAIAAAMARSNREIPHYYLGADLDVSRALRWLEAANAAKPVTERVLFAALLLKATAMALREVPDLNGFWIDDAFRPSEAIHVGVAVSLRQGGLVAPAIHDTDAKTLVEIMKDLQDVVARARAGTLRSSEMSDPTITVTNLGDQGTDSVYGVILPPQVALVGFGRVRERPWADAGMLGVRPVIHASLAADHRASDGHRGARFLAAITRLLSTPEEL